MNSIQLVKYDLISIFKSPLTYLALLLTILPMIGFTILFVQQSDEMNGNTLLSIGSWFFSIMGLLFVIKTITRDISQGTIQLYMNKTSSRVGYVVAKVVSIILIAILITAILVAFVLIVQGIVDGKNINMDKIFALVVPKTALIFTLGIFLVLIVPFAEPFLPMIPKIGDNIQDSLKYIPFSYLTSKTTSGDYTFSNWQWFITSASIVILFIINLFYASKKDI